MRTTRNRTFWDEDYFDQFVPTDIQVQDIVEETHSRLLGPDGNPIPYKKQGLGFIGFIDFKRLRHEAPRRGEATPSQGNLGAV